MTVLSTLLPFTDSFLFAGLPMDSTDNPNTTPTVTKNNRSPPIILYGIQDINKLTPLVETVINRNEFTYRIISKQQIKINTTNLNTYKLLIDLIRKEGRIGHTFSRKDERPYRIVINNLHPSTPLEAIRDEIENAGHKIRGPIINA